MDESPLNYRENFYLLLLSFLLKASLNLWVASTSQTLIFFRLFLFRAGSPVEGSFQNTLGRGFCEIFHLIPSPLCSKTIKTKHDFTQISECIQGKTLSPPMSPLCSHSPSRVLIFPSPLAFSNCLGISLLM